MKDKNLNPIEKLLAPLEKKRSFGPVFRRRRAKRESPSVTLEKLAQEFNAHSKYESNIAFIKPRSTSHEDENVEERIDNILFLLPESNDKHGCNAIANLETISIRNRILDIVTACRSLLQNTHVYRLSAVVALFLISCCIASSIHISYLNSSEAQAVNSLTKERYLNDIEVLKHKVSMLNMKVAALEKQLYEQKINEIPNGPNEQIQSFYVSPRSFIATQLLQADKSQVLLCCKDQSGAQSTIVDQRISDSKIVFLDETSGLRCLNNCDAVTHTYTQEEVAKVRKRLEEYYGDRHEKAEQYTKTILVSEKYK